MKINLKTPHDIDSYIMMFPPEIQDILTKVRETIRQAAPGAEEAMAYGIPTFRLNGNLVHFGAANKHIGFYPAPSAIEAFKKELKPYKWAKGSVQFPYDQPIPYELIREMTKFRVLENLEKAKNINRTK